MKSRKEIAAQSPHGDLLWMMDVSWHYKKPTRPIRWGDSGEYATLLLGTLLPIPQTVTVLPYVCIHCSTECKC
jgi:hypothetical protein